MPKDLFEQIAFAEANDYPIVYSYYEKISLEGERSNRVIKTDVSNTCRGHALYRESLGSRSGNKLKMFRGQWIVLRKYAGLSISKTMACMLVYACHGLRKFFV